MNQFLVAQISFQQIVKITSPVSWTFPVPLLLESYKKRDYKGIPTLQFPSIALQQLCWVIYGLKKDEFIVLVMSLCAFLLYLSYSIIYLRLTKQNLKIIVLFMTMAVQTMTLQFCSEDAIGLVAAMSQMCSSFMNLQNINKSIKEKNGSYFNRCSLMIQLPNNICWVMLALELKDIILLLPNSLDTIMSSVQCILYFSLPHSTKLSYIPLQLEKEDYSTSAIPIQKANSDQNPIKKLSNKQK